MIDIESRLFDRCAISGMLFGRVVHVAVLTIGDHVDGYYKNDHCDPRNDLTDLMRLQTVFVDDRSFFRLRRVVADGIEPWAASKKTIWRFIWHDYVSILGNAVIFCRKTRNIRITALSYYLVGMFAERLKARIWIGVKK